MEVLPYQTGFRIGDLELELKEAKSWVANGRKGYLYVMPDGSVIIKQKGVSLRASMDEAFEPEKALAMILDTLSIVKECTDNGMLYDDALEHLRRLEKRPSINVHQMQFVTKRNALQGKKVTVDTIKQTRFLLESLKRRICLQENTIDTLPFGYCDHLD
jgi:hypothetical protein